jgi:hypothetical protein
VRWTANTLIKNPGRQLTAAKHGIFINSVDDDVNAQMRSTRYYTVKNKRSTDHSPRDAITWTRGACSIGLIIRFVAAIHVKILLCGACLIVVMHGGPKKDCVVPFLRPRQIS